jgi:hypothetical protein
MRRARHMCNCAALAAVLNPSRKATPKQTECIKKVVDLVVVKDPKDALAIVPAQPAEPATPKPAKHKAKQLAWGDQWAKMLKD